MNAVAITNNEKRAEESVRIFAASAAKIYQSYSRGKRQCRHQ
jgi:hypothetical protein